jgi:hypothetical protein
MAKASGSTRASRWRSSDNKDKLYYRDGVRVEYSELDEPGKKLVKNAKKKVAKELYAKLKNVTTRQVIDDGKEIRINYTSHGLDHFANDAMLNLSGKYFSRTSMMKVNEILEKATYFPSSHALSHPRTDGRELWFTYKDADGRGVYFKVCKNSKIKAYELYSVVDEIK